MQRDCKQLRQHDSRRKGVAMLLVLISLMTATVITAAYLASRDNSGAIGDNIANASAARWGAASGMNMAVTILETEANWRTAHSNGVLLQNHAFAQCALQIVLRDLENGNPPSANTTYLETVVTATAGNLEHDASARLMAPLPNVANVDLGEFAMFADGSIEFKTQSRLERWPEAPLSQLGMPVSLGTRASSMGSIALANSSLAIDAVAWLPPGATPSTINNASMLDVNAILMQDAIALAASPEPTLSGPTTTLGSLLGFVSSTLNNILSTSNIEVVEMVVDGLKSLLFSGYGIVVQNDLTVTDNARLSISGDAVIVVHGNLTVQSAGAIELVGNSTLRLYVGGSVDIRGYVGEAGGRTSGLNSDGLGHSDVSRIQIFSMASDDELSWRLRQNALVKAVIYAPDARVRLFGSSRLCGRVAAGTIEVADVAVVYYDQALDRRTGYTNPASPIYDADGRIKPAYGMLQSLNDDDLAALAASENVKVRAFNRDHGSVSTVAPVVAEGDSTPRPVPVNLSQISYDTSVTRWEQR